MYRLGLAYGRLTMRWRWYIFALWLVGLLVSLPLAANIPGVLKSGGYDFSGTESYTAYNLMLSKLHYPATQLVVVFQSASTPVRNAAYQRELHGFMTRARTFPHVINLVPGEIGKDGNTTYVLINFNDQIDDVEGHLSKFQTLLPQGNTAGPARTYLVGEATVANALVQISQQDAEHADTAVLPIALIVLLVVFGTLVAALLPLLLAMLAVLIALAVVYLIALHSATNVSVLSIVSILGLGISIDYSLLIVRRFREELAQGRNVRDAIAWTVATAGEAILFSGLTVIIGLMGMLLLGLQSMTSIGVAGSVVVAVALLAALTLLPALLSILGARINSLRVPLLGRLTVQAVRPAAVAAANDGDTTTARGGNSSQQSGATDQHGFWHTLAFTVMKRPLLVILIVVALLAVLGWPIFSLNIGTSSDAALPANSPVRQGLAILNAQFSDANNNPTFVVVQTPDGSSMLTPANLQRLAHLTQWINQQPHVVSVTGLMQLPSIQGTPTPSLSQQELTAIYSTGAYTQNAALSQFVSSTTAGNTTLITVKVDAAVDSAAGKALIDNLRAGDKAAGQGLQSYVGGIQAVYLDFDRTLYNHFPWTILFIVIATYILLLLMFRSVLLPLKAILMNVLSVGAAYGVLVYVFQWGNFGNILNFTSSGFVDSLIPILLFCILFGLSMDYEVFLLSRIREEWLRTHDNHWAVAHGLEQTGSVITSAALLLVIVTCAFTFTELLITKEMGLGMTVAILVDATIIRSLLVPATMQLLGKWNWWFPSFSRRQRSS